MWRMWGFFAEEECVKISSSFIFKEAKASLNDRSFLYCNENRKQNSTVLALDQSYITAYVIKINTSDEEWQHFGEV